MILVLVSAPIISSAEEECVDAKVTNTADKLAMVAKGCPNNDMIHTLCNYVGEETPEDSTSENIYRYQTIINNAACITSDLSPTEKKKRMDKFWVMYGKDIQCQNLTFYVKGNGSGSLIKYAVSIPFDDFMRDVISNWQVPPEALNVKDKADGLTVLDYIEQEKTKAKSAAISSQLQKYYDKLKLLGAKHAKDI